MSVPQRRALFLLSRSRLRDALVVAALLLSRPSAHLFLSGSAVFLAGLALHVWSKGALLRNRTLTVTGPYALCRNPFYLSNLLIDLAICLIAGRPWLAVLYVPAFLLVYRSAIQREESFLQRRFPGEYASFSHSPSLLPMPPRRWRLLKGRWSLRTILREREASRALRLLAIPLLVLCAGDIRAGGWRECLEAECIAWLLGAASLHLMGRVVYQVYERSGRKAFLSPRWAAAGWGASLLVLGCVATVARLPETDLPQLAERFGAVPIASSDQFDAVRLERSPSLFVVDDDSLRALPADSSRRFHRLRAVWSRFEVYYLVRAESGPKATSPGGLAPSRSHPTEEMERGTIY